METNSINNPEPISLPPLIPTPPKNIYKSLFFIFLGLFIVVSVILVYSLVSFTKTETQTPQKITEVIITTPTPTSTPTIVNDGTQDWKTYTNSTYKFSIQYPKDWKVDIKPNKFVVMTLNSPEYMKNINNPPTNYIGIPGDQFMISFYKSYKNILTSNKSLEEYLSDKNLYTEYTTQKINNLTFYKAGVMGLGSQTVYFSIRGEDLYEFSFNVEVTKTDEQIINSFKFN